jgi:hypothetical protein
MVLYAVRTKLKSLKSSALNERRCSYESLVRKPKSCRPGPAGIGRVRAVTTCSPQKVSRDGVANAVLANLPWTRQRIHDIRSGLTALRFRYTRSRS